MQYVEQVAAKPEAEVPLVLKPVDKAVGEVLKANEEERIIKLAGSGTIRTDLR